MTKYSCGSNGNQSFGRKDNNSVFRGRYSISLRCYFFLPVLMAGPFALSSINASAQIFDRYIMIQPIQLCNDDGENCAPVTTYSTETRVIYRQAGVLPIFLPATQFHDSNKNNEGTGVNSVDPDGKGGGTTVQAWFVSDLMEAPDRTLYGEAHNGGNGIVVDGNAVTNFSAEGRRDTFAHELGHNLGLGHDDFGAGASNNLITQGEDREVPRGVEEIIPNGRGLSVLTDAQINELRKSGLVQAAADCEGDGGSNIIERMTGEVCLNLRGLGGDDSLILAGGVVLQHLAGGTGSDTISVHTAGGVGGNIEGNDGDDTISLAEGTFVMGDVDGGSGKDILEIAAEVENVRGGTGNDTITLDVGAMIFGSLFGDDADNDEGNGDGNDIIIMNDGLVFFDIDGEGGDDTITLNGGSVGRDLLGGGGYDIITINGGRIGRDVLAGHGDDQVTLNGGVIDRDLLGGAGNDLITINAGTIGGDMLAGQGDDKVRLLGGLIRGDIMTEQGRDNIILDGARVSGNIDSGADDDDLVVSSGFVHSVLTGNGDDTMRWDGGTIENVIHMGAGSDTLDIYGIRAGGTASQVGLTALDGGDTASSADGQVDILNLRGISGLLTDLRNWENINLMTNSSGDLGPAGRTITTERFHIEAGSSLLASSAAGHQVFSIAGTLANDGLIDMQQAASYDELNVTDIYRGGADSVLALEIAVGANGSSGDKMRVGTATEGRSGLLIQDTDPAGAGVFNPLGIELVRVESAATGSTAPEHFYLSNGPIHKDLWTYNLGFDNSRTNPGRAGADVHVLYSSPSDIVQFTPNFATAALTAYHASAEPWYNRREGIAKWLNDPASLEQGDGTGPAAANVWLAPFGSYRTAKASFDYSAFGKTTNIWAGYKQSTYGILGGVDFISTLDDERTILAGLYGGYVASAVSPDSIAISGDFSGATIGAYGGYIDGGLSIWAMAKADLMTFDWRAATLGLHSSTAVDTVGARIEAAYRLPLAAQGWLEPYANLTYANSSWRQFTVLSTSFDLNGNESLLGQGGLKIGIDTADDVSRLSAFAGVGLSHDFIGRSSANILSGGMTLPLVHEWDRLAVDVKAGLSWSHQNGVSVELSSVGQFSRSVRQISGQATLKLSF